MLGALTIIGVIAAITVPVLINAFVAQSNKSALKKIKFNMEQSFSLYLTDSGKTSLRSTQITSESGVQEFLKTYLQIIKDCGHTPVASSCLSDGYKDKNNQVYQYPENSTYYCVITTNSASVCMSPFSLSENKGDLIFDINGLNKPNHLDSDVYKFYYDENGYLTQEITLLDEDPSVPIPPSGGGSNAPDINNDGNNPSIDDEEPSVTPPNTEDTAPEEPEVTPPSPEPAVPDKDNKPDKDPQKDPEDDKSQGGGSSGGNSDNPGGLEEHDEFTPCTTTSGITGIKVYTVAQKIGISEGYQCVVDLGYSAPVNTFLPENTKYNSDLAWYEKWPIKINEFLRYENDYMVGAAKACYDAGLEIPDMYIDLDDIGIKRLPESVWTKEKYWMNLAQKVNLSDKGNGYYVQVEKFDPKATVWDPLYFNETTRKTYIKRTTPGLRTMCYEKMK